MKAPILAVLAIAAAGITAAAFQQSEEKVFKPSIGIKTHTPAEAKEKGTELAVIGGGCFWCPERDYRKKAGIVATDVGYMGGTVKNPTYKQVCTGTTGHVEVTRIEYDPKVISYREVLDIFFQIHDPTQINRQGPDIGEQYRSVIFYMNDEQKKIAEEAKKAAYEKYQKPIATTIEPAKEYWRAEEYHQQYYEKKGIG